MLRFLFFIGLLTMASPSWATTMLPEDKTAAIILAYSRIGEDTRPDTNLTQDQFNAHLTTFLSGNYNILPLPQIIHSWQNNENLPENTIAITFEGAYRSAYNGAMKQLLEHDIPFTIFYAADATTPEHLDSKTLKKLARDKSVTIGVLPTSLTRHSDKSNQNIQEIIFKTITKHRDIFKRAPTLFSYPFGEFSKQLQNHRQRSRFHRRARPPIRRRL